MGWLDQPRGFANYADFQLFVSSFPIMTGRPVSALLHGLAYWFIGATSSLHHAVNLVLLLASVLLVYGALAAVTSQALAFLTAMFALTYPSASGTAFSSIMMNSNLAGLFWGTALYLDARSRPHKARRRDFAVSGLFLLSALSYEAFVPLFVASPIIRIVKRGELRLDPRLLLKDCAPLVATLFLFGAYRGLAEKLIFPDSHPTASAPGAAVVISRLLQALVLGPKESLGRSLKISINSLGNLALVSLPHVILICGSLVVLSAYMYTRMGPRRLGGSPPTASSRVGECRASRVEEARWFYPLAIATGIYVAANLIFVFSVYIPNSIGFESRTQGGIRFAVALLVAVIAMTLYRLSEHTRLRRLIGLGTVGLWGLFAVSIVGQREAWIAAAQYNNVLLQRMDSAIRRSGLNEQAAFTFVADLPVTFPHEVNGEPIFGETWDLSPALGLLYPTSDIRANVYEPLGTIIRPDGVILHGYWKAKYPFYLYKFINDNVYLISKADDFNKILAQASDTHKDGL